MRGYRHIVDLGHGRNLLQFEHAAAMANIRLQDGAHLTLNQFAKSPARQMPLPGRDGHGRRVRQGQEGFIVLRMTGLFGKKRTKRFQFAHKNAGHGRAQSPVEIHGDIDVVAHGLPDRRDTRHHKVYRSRRVHKSHRSRRCTHFHSFESLGNRLLRTLGALFGGGATDAGIHADSVADLAAQ